MRERLTRLARGLALLALLAGMMVPGFAFADDDERKEAREEGRSEQFRSERDDRQVTGQVLEINSLKDPPEMVVANMDGEIQVRLLTKDLIQKNAVRLGDHVTLFGEKISEVEFDCQELSVDGHLGDDPDEADDDD